VRVTVVYAAPGVEAIEPVDLPRRATVADAVVQSGLPHRLGLPETLSYAIHGQRARADTLLADGDRVEILRPLVADAKAVRRARAAVHPLPPTRKVKRGPGGQGDPPL
jgi:putative ubiquitin-RnfH superfamily antitoxin RatB of RatAB toxin-antitoxin module